MKRITACIGSLLFCLLVGAVVSPAKTPTGGPVEETPEDPSPGDLYAVEIPVDTDCQANCCGSSGGNVKQTTDGGLVCYIADDDPDAPAKVALFESCANDCD